MKKLKKILLVILALLILVPFCIVFYNAASMFLQIPKIGPDSEFASTYLDEEFGIDSRDYTVLHKEEGHGGFHGDGLYHIALDCSQNMDEMAAVVVDWRSLPLPENLYKVMFSPGFDLAGQASIPDVQNGYYYFHNRHSEARFSWDTDIFGHASYNFSIGIFDSDTNILYFVAFDT